MVRLGRTYGNLMVDVVASNAKLRARARRAVELATDASDEEVDAALVGRGRRREGRDRLAADRRSTPTMRARRLEEAGGVDPPRAGAERMRLGVEAAVVDGVLLRGDVEIADGRIAAVGLNGGAGSGIAIPGLVDLQVNGFGGVDFAGADVGRLPPRRRGAARDAA